MQKIRIKNGVPVLGPGEVFHSLKTHSKFFDLVWNDEKNFELRRNDRNFKYDDIICLEEVRDDLTYTGRQVLGRVKYVLKSVIDFGLEEGFCIIQLDRETIRKRFSTGRIDKSLDVRTDIDGNQLFEDFFNGDRSFPVLPWNPVLQDFEEGQTIVLRETDETSRRTGRIISATISRVVDDLDVLTVTGILIVLDLDSINCIYDPYIVGSTGDHEIEGPPFARRGSEIVNQTLEEPSPRDLTIFVSPNPSFDKLFDKGIIYPIYIGNVDRHYIKHGDKLKIEEKIGSSNRLSGRSVRGVIASIVPFPDDEVAIVFYPRSLYKTIPKLGKTLIPIHTDPRLLEEWKIPTAAFFEYRNVKQSAEKSWRSDELRWIKSVNKPFSYHFEDAFSHVAGEIQEDEDGHFWLGKAVPYTNDPNEGERDWSRYPHFITDLNVAKRIIEFNVVRTIQGEPVIHNDGKFLVHKQNVNL